MAYYLFRQGWLTEADLTTATIDDKSKANPFTKAIAFVQITWFMAQLVGRFFSELPVATIEHVTLAYVVCAIWSYYFWWHKPFDIQSPHVLDIDLPCLATERNAIFAESENAFDLKRIQTS